MSNTTEPKLADYEWSPRVGSNSKELMRVPWGDPLIFNAAASPEKRTTVLVSGCDWLDPEVPVEWLARFLKLIHDTPNLNWLLLTKRPENWEKRVIAGALRLRRTNQSAACFWREWAHRDGMFPRNVWVGTSVEDQTRADQRIPALLKIPAVGRFLSLEPLLGPVALDLDPVAAAKRDADRCQAHPEERAVALEEAWQSPRINWVIIGGESGPGARPCNVDWIRSLVRQCRVAGTPPFVKQVGARPVYTASGGSTDNEAAKAIRAHWEDPRWFIDWNSSHNSAAKITHPKGGDPSEWPEDLRVREFPKGLRGGM